MNEFYETQFSTQQSHESVHAMPLENSFIVELHDGSRIEILRHAVVSIINGEK